MTEGKKIKVLLSSGGTGGHMSPASALAHDLVSRGYEVELATDTRGMKYASMFKGISIHTLPSGTSGAGLSGKVKGGVKLAQGILQAFILLRRHRPDCVVGFGGYPSVPAVFAAQIYKIPTMLHEQNAIIGKANVFLANKANRIALSIENFSGLEEDQKARCVVTGNPVRDDICALYTKPYNTPVMDGDLKILIMGGSLGATVFSDVVPKAFARLSPEYRSRLKIVQQCREADLEQVRESYKVSGIDAQLSIFIDNVADNLSACHLFIGRSGASTVAEVTVAGRPSIFVPYPHHKDQQQKMNADAVAENGGAWVMTEDGFTQEALLARVETFLQNPEMLFRAAEKAREFGKPDAGRKLGNLVTALASGWQE